MDTIETAKTFIEKYIYDRPVKKIAFSAPLYKSNPFFKITVQPTQNKNTGPGYQFALYYETKVKHENYTSLADICQQINKYIDEGYKQCDIMLYGENVKILMNKNKTCKIIRSKTAPKTNPVEDGADHSDILRENTVIPWLIALGITDNEGRVIPKYSKKFRQLNKFLEMVRDISGSIPDNAEIIDFGCGKSYLTFALYYYLNILNNKNATITGLDIKQDVVAECQRLAALFGFEKLRFLAENIETYRHHRDTVDLVITLHACDTATDYALFSAVNLGARVILSVPCCQHELFKQIKNEDMRPLLKHGILKERFSAVLTDALRAALLESVGYQCSVIEFIDLAHTPKNVMIRGLRKKNAGFQPAAFAAYKNLADLFSVRPTLYELFKKAGYLKN